MNLYNYLGVNHKQLFFDISLLTLLIVAGYLLSGTLIIANGEEIVNQEELSILGIFYNNIKISFFSIVGTIIFGYFILLVNGIILGMAIQTATNIYSIQELFVLLGFHGPIEIVGWLLTLQISMKITKRILDKNSKFPSRTLVSVTILLYLVGAVIESIISRGV